jgi:hypothetical protein
MRFLVLFFLALGFPSYAGDDDEVSVNIANLPEGKHVVFEWQGMPTMVLKPTKEQLQLIKRNKTQVTSQDIDSAFQSYAKMSGNEKASMLYHSTKDAYQKNELINQYPVIVLLAVSPIRGCAIKADYDENVLVDPCSGIGFSLDGKPLDRMSEFSSPLFIPSFVIKDDYLTISTPETKNVIDFSPDILASNQPDKLKLFDAISWDKLDVVKTLIKKDSSLLFVKTSVDCNVIHLAASKSKELLSYFIDKGVSTTHVCNRTYTPVMFSVLMKKYENAALLLNHDAKIEAYCEGDECAKSLVNYLEYDNNYTPEDANSLIEKILKIKAIGTH